MQIFAGVLWRASNYSVVVDNDFLLAISPPKALDIRPTSLHTDMQTLVGFPMISEHMILMILNEPEWLFVSEPVGLEIFCMAFENNCTKIQIDLTHTISSKRVG